MGATMGPVGCNLCFSRSQVQSPGGAEEHTAAHVQPASPRATTWRGTTTHHILFIKLLFMAYVSAEASPQIPISFLAVLSLLCLLSHAKLL